MNVLLTGIPGWLGSRFLNVLIKGFEGKGPINNWKIRCLVMQGAEPAFLNDLKQIKDIEYVIGDITKSATLKKSVEGIDLVFHMAGVIHPRKISQFYKVNTLGTKNMMEASISAGVRKFVYISSNSAGGINTNRCALMDENDESRPYLNYGLSKYKAECIVNYFQKMNKIETVILRPCWFYGPNQPLRQTKFFKMIQGGRPIVFGNGENLRSMTYIDNLCQAMLLVAEKKVANGQTYWIGDSRSYTCNEIYKTIAELFKVNEFKPRYLPDFISTFFFLMDNILQRLGIYVKEVHVAGEMNKNIACSIKKAKEDLGYDPKIGLKQGMLKSIQWCKKNDIIM